MSHPLRDLHPSRQLRDSLFVLGAIGGALFVAGFIGYGNFAATLPGMILLVLAGYLGVRLSRSTE